MVQWSVSYGQHFMTFRVNFEHEKLGFYYCAWEKAGEIRSEDTIWGLCSLKYVIQYKIESTFEVSTFAKFSTIFNSRFYKKHTQLAPKKPIEIRIRVLFL